MIAETREFIERFKGTYSKTNQVQSRVRMLENWNSSRWTRRTGRR